MTRQPLEKIINTSKSVNQLYEGIRKCPYSFLLDTGLVLEGLGRFSVLGADPFATIVSKNGRTILHWLHQGTREFVFINKNPLDVMAAIMKDFTCVANSAAAPFAGGAVGFISYDLGRQLERVPEQAVDDLDTPDLLFGLYDTVLVVDNLSGEQKIVSTGYPEMEPGEVVKRARARIDWLKDLIDAEDPVEMKDQGSWPAVIRANFNKETYQSNVMRAIEHILDGDIFQVNLSQRFEIASDIGGWALYRNLKGISPAPFAAYLNFAPIEIICSSPERFLQLDHQGKVETRPIKGTRPRGTTREEDVKNYTALEQSQKDRAELTMIVDLERSDLGKVCKIGSVTADLPYRIESFPTVFHLVSTVRGALPEDKGIFELLKAAFPGGSITGAPKIKAMEIIDRLEPVRRGVYTGTLGYIGFDGRADLNIIIRTIVKIGGKYYFQVGGGITADSHPEEEYYETLDKAKALLRALTFEGSIHHGPYVY